MPNWLVGLGEAVPQIEQMQKDTAVQKAMQQEAVMRNYQVQQVKQEQEALSKPIPLKMLQGTMDQHLYDALVPILQANGGTRDVNGEPVTNRRALNMAQQSIQSNDALHSSLLKQSWQNSLEKQRDTKQQIDEATASGDLKKVQKLTPVLQAQSKQTDGLWNELSAPQLAAAGLKAKTAELTAYNAQTGKNLANIQTPAPKGMLLAGPDGQLHSVAVSPGTNLAGYQTPAQAISAEKPSAEKDTQKFMDIRMRELTGKPVSDEEKAWRQAYTDSKGVAAIAKQEAMQPKENLFKNWSDQDKGVAFEKRIYGEKPDLGSGYAASGNHAQFEKEYAHWLSTLGISGKQAVNLANTNKADFKSLVQATTGLDAISSFGNSADKTFKILTSVADNYKKGQYPGVNNWSQIFDYYTGDPNVASLRNAVQTSVLDYMKVVTSGSNISGAELSMTAQKRAAEMIKAADSPETMKNSLSVMSKEMKAAEAGRKEQKDIILKRMNTTQFQPSAQGQTAKPVDASKIPINTVKTFPDGTLRRKEKDGWHLVTK